MLVSEGLKRIQEASDAAKLLETYSYYGLSESEKAQISSLDLKHYSGKVRELLSKNNELFILHTDRLTAFDRYIGMVPFKGLILSELSNYWMKTCSEVVPSAYLGRINERCIHAEACEPVKAEVIVRGYLAGSMHRAYDRGERLFCGVNLEEGLSGCQKLAKPILTPTSKAAAFEHDVDSSPEELIRDGIVSDAEWQQIERMALQLFELGTKLYEEKGWILVDTKYEFGRNSKGDIVLIDEAHTPDSSRLWVESTYQERVKAGQHPEMLDKENVRRYLLEQGFKGEGEVPVVPAAQLVDLSRVYLTVAETMLQKELHFELPYQSLSPFL